MQDQADTKMLSHMVEAVRASCAELEPFPHAIIYDFFPTNVYEQLLGFLPEDERYESFSYGKHHTTDGRSNRMRFRMENEWLDCLCGPQRDFWYSLRSALAAPQLKNAVYEKVSTGLAYRFGVPASEVNQLAGHALPELFREFSSYRIAPHPDTRRKVVTMQISLACDASQPAWGTEFYRRSLNPLHLLREPRSFEVVKCTPYLPNTAYCFSVLNTVSWKSWHGRSTLPGAQGVRNTILNIWYLEARDANLDIDYKRSKPAA